MTLPGPGGADFDGDGVSDHQLRPDLADLIAKPTGIDVVPEPGMDFTAALTESVDQPPFGSGAVELVAHADQEPAATDHLHTDAIG